MKTAKRVALAILLAMMAVPAAASAEQETNCTDGKDNDGDTVFDCGDADCKDDEACQKDGKGENNDARCSDWIDNDGNGFTDCDDKNCQIPGIKACYGSIDLQEAAAESGTSSSTTSSAADTIDVPDGVDVEDLIGKGGDNDGERNDVLCSDGVDNDNDGRIDCADFGCRFDATVTVCQGDPDFRFSVVARVEASRDLEQETSDARFSTLQMRAFGPMPYIQDSFFLLSLRAEKTPRLTFAMFQVPLGGGGHYVNINSGTGGLSTTLVRSAHKRLLLEPAFYVYNAFEQGNGAAIEIGGPIDNKDRFLFRSYVAGGTGRFSGNVGGGYFADDERNFAYSTGAQITGNLIGYYSRWDSPMLYTPVPLTLSTSIGVKYDQRPDERFAAVNGQATFRWKRFILLAENYTKREFEFESWQYAYNFQVGFLVWPKRVLVAADFGEFLTKFDEDSAAILPEGITTQLQETQGRIAAHFYLWRNIFIGSIMYTDRRVDPRPGETEDQVERSIKAVAQYRF